MSPAEFMTADLIRFAFIVGMVLSVYMYEKSHLTTGSIVVPGFLGIHIFDPWVILITVVNAWVCFSLVHVVLPRFVLMQTRHKFYLLVMLSALIHLAWRWLATMQLEFAFAGDAMMGFGYVIPGLIAHDMSRNGWARTSLNVFIASQIVGGILFLSISLLPQLSLNLQEVELLDFSFDLAFVLALSTLGEIVLKSQTPVRSGGYVTAAYVVFFGASPLTIVAIIVVAVATYWINVCFLMPTMIVFGRRKFAIMLIIAAVGMWCCCSIAETLQMNLPILSHPAYAGVVILLPGLIANDMQRTSFTRVATGLGLLTSWIFAIASLVYEIRFFSRPDYVIQLVACCLLILLVVATFSNLDRSEVNSHKALPNPNS